MKKIAKTPKRKERPRGRFLRISGLQTACAIFS